MPTSGTRQFGVLSSFIAACDQPRYELLGVAEYHDNCSDNLAAGLAELGLTKTVTPSPLNLFMHIPWTAKGGLSWEESRCRTRALT